jgi:hypothetical protein
MEDEAAIALRLQIHLEHVNWPSHAGGAIGRRRAAATVRLKHPEDAFCGALDSYSLSDLIENRTQLVRPHLLVIPELGVPKKTTAKCDRRHDGRLSSSN